MKDEGISINGLAQAIRMPANRISLIVNETRGTTRTRPRVDSKECSCRRHTGKLRVETR
jgi:hypothetical protein